MDTASGDCFELNAAGASAWDLIGRGLSLNGVLEEIVREYAVDRSVAHEDLLRLVDDLARRGIVRVVPR